MRNEEKPMIARDELAARCLVALLSNAGRVGHGSNVVDAVTCADALIARLASRPLAALSPAPVVGALAGVESKGQTFTCPKCGSHEFGTSNCTSPFSAWVGHCDNHDCRFSWPRELDDAKYFTPAPAPSPYVPRVGDVVGIDGGKEYGETRVVTAVDGVNVKYTALTKSGGPWLHERPASLLQYIRPATASERAAAGLPVDRSVDRSADEATTPPAPASVEPRRTVGAVVRSANGAEFIVVLPGFNVERAEQRLLSDPVVCASTCDEDSFVRWATRAECERHGVPFVDRTPPAATPAYPVDAAGRPLWVRVTGPEDADFVTIGKVYHVKGWNGTSPEILNDKGVLWCLAGDGERVEATWPSWEPCAAPTDAVPPAAALTEEERADLRDAIWKERTAWLATGADQRSEPDVYANAAAAWFAKRDGTVKP